MLTNSQANWNILLCVYMKYIYIYEIYVYDILNSNMVPDKNQIQIQDFQTNASEYYFHITEDQEPKET